MVRNSNPEVSVNGENFQPIEHRELVANALGKLIDDSPTRYRVTEEENPSTVAIDNGDDKG